MLKRLFFGIIWCVLATVATPSAAQNTEQPKERLLRVYRGTFFNFGAKDPRAETNERGAGYPFDNGVVGPGEKLSFEVLSGRCDNITLHAVQKSGVWMVLYNGKPRDLTYAEFFQRHKENKKIDHFLLTVNGMHEQYSNVAADVAVYHYDYRVPKREDYFVRVEPVDPGDSNHSFRGVAIDGESTLRIEIQVPGRKAVRISHPRIGTLKNGPQEIRPPRQIQAYDPENIQTNVKIQLDDNGIATLEYVPPVFLSRDQWRKHKAAGIRPEYVKYEPEYISGEREKHTVFETISYMFEDIDGGVRTGQLVIELIRPPVMFVHGFLGDRSTWKEMAQQLTQEGFITSVDAYHAGIQNSIDDQSERLAGYIEKMLDELGATHKLSKVDVVCHSMGGLIARGYVQDKELYKDNVRKLITVGTPHHGIRTPGYYVGKLGSFATGIHGEAINQLHESSTYLAQLNRGYESSAHLVPGIEYGNMYVYPTDGVVSASSARLNGVHSFVFPRWFKHSTSQSGIAYITTHAKTRIRLLDWLTNEKIPPGRNDYIEIELSKKSEGRIMNSFYSALARGQMSKRLWTKNLPTKVTQNSFLSTGPDSRAVVHFKWEKKTWGAIFLQENSEIYISSCTPEMMNIRLVKGRALFKSSWEKSGRDKFEGHFWVDIDADSPRYGDNGWFKFNPFGAVEGLSTAFSIDFDGKQAAITSLEGELELKLPSPSGEKVVSVAPKKAFVMADGAAKPTVYQKEDWWIDLASVIAESGVPQNTAVAAGGTAAGDSKLKSGDSAMEKKTSGLSSEKNTDGESGSSLLWILALLAVVPLLLGGVIVFIIALVKRRRASAAAPAQNSGLHSRNGQKILFAVAAALLVILAWGAVALMFAKSCGGSGESTVYGVVTDANKRPLSGVTVRAGEQEVITGQWGTFMLEKISAQTPELPVTFSKESYARSQRMVKSNVPATQLRVALISLNTDAQVTTIQNSNGGKATTPGGASVQFPAQGVASGTDDVVVKMAHFTPDHPLFGELSPGDGALSGKGNDGTDFIIDSAALIFVEMEDASGAEVKLAEGKTATLSMPAPGVVAGQAQGLFSYDFESGRWKEESGAMVVDGIATGNVSHFSVWNVGAKSGAATVTGQVIDRNGRPLAGQKVQVDKLSAVTNAQGHYQLGVPAGKALKVRMNFKGFDIDMDAGPIDAGASETIDLSVPPMTYVVGTLNDCDAAQQSGQVHLMWDETEYSTMYTADGRFEVSLPSVVKEGTFSATAAGFTVEVPFKNAQGLSEIQLGAVAVCPKQQETPDDKKAPSKAVDTGAVDTAGDTVQKKTESIDTGSASKDTSSSVETPSADTDTASVDTETAPANSGGAGGGVAGKYNFVSRSDGKRLVSYHYILLNSDGTSAEEYSPLNSNGYVSRMTGTWSVSGDTLLLHYRHGNDTYKVNGNQLVGTSDDGTSFTFVK